MNKEIKDRLDKLENELNESKDEIHNLKSSVSLTIERGIGELLSRFTRKQLILGSVIALFLISIIGIAGTVTKTYTFSSGEVVSASKFNTNFDTLFTLVNGNLDDNNISGISGSKITSGTVAAARLDNLSGSKITSGTVAAARIDNLSASIITSGVFDNSTIPKPANHITIFSGLTPTTYNGDLGGRSGADTICENLKDDELISMYNNSCSNVRALISVSASDEIRDFPTTYSVPTNVKVRSQNGRLISDTWSGLFATSSGGDPSGLYGNLSNLVGISWQTGGGVNDWGIWTGSESDGSLNNNHCSGWTSEAPNVNGGYGMQEWETVKVWYGGNVACNNSFKNPLYCICF